MPTFINTASWMPAPGGLAGDAEFRRLFFANSATLAKLYVFREIILNKPGREEQKRATQVGCHIPTDSDNLIILIATLVLC
jgi:hypothetical protein